MPRFWSPTLSRRDIRVDAVFDIEAEEWTKFVVGAVYRKFDVYKSFHWSHEEDMVDDLLSIEGTIWAHFGGGYDYKWLLDHMAKRGVSTSPLVAGSRVISFTVGKSQFCDSYALAPMKLADLTSGLGVEKQKLGLPCVCCEPCMMARKERCDCDNYCGGFCSITRNMQPALFARLEEYLEADCRSLFAALSNLREYAAKNDIDLGMTIGSSAWRNVRRLHSTKPVSLNEKEWRFCRVGYFGGRVQLTKRNPAVAHLLDAKNPNDPALQSLLDQYAIDGHELDVNSMYPWCLAANPVPVGEHRWIDGVEARDAFAKAEPGIYHAIVDVPDMYLPPLPYRYSNGTAVGYPTGSFEGTWAHPELIYAVEGGCNVYVDQAIVWDLAIVKFADWIGKLWELRDAAGKKTPVGTFLKLYMNSLTGKFGSGIERDRYEINPRKLKDCNCLCPSCRRSLNDPDCEHDVDCTCQAHRQLSDWVFASRYFRLDPCSHVEWAAYLTSYARVKLHKFFMLRNGGRDVFYCDTDSCFRTENITDPLIVGKQLGMFNYEGPVRRFIGIAPKVYSFTRESNLVAKAKGLSLDRFYSTKADGSPHPRAGKPREAPVPGHSYSKKGVRGFSSGAHFGKFFSMLEMNRRLFERCGDRVILENGIDTRASTANELDKL